VRTHGYVASLYYEKFKFEVIGIFFWYKEGKAQGKKNYIAKQTFRNIQVPEMA
jgi:hypothetical protein